MPAEDWHSERLHWQTERLRATHAQSGSLKLVTAPTVEPVSLDEAKSHCTVDFDDDDDLISDLVSSARLLLEGRTHRAFNTQTWDYAFDLFGSWNAPLILPLCPLISVTSVTSYSTADAGTVMSSSTYLVDTFSEPGRIALNDGQLWPVTGLRLANAGIVRFVAGYGPNATDVPLAIRQAIKLLVGHWYKNRETTQDGRIATLDFTVDALLSPYTVARV